MPQKVKRGSALARSRISRIEAEFARRVSDYARRCYGRGLGDGEWTRAVKKILFDIGFELGYRTASSGVDQSHWGEWLYDVCWYTVQSDGFSLRKLVLAAEIEWSPAPDQRQIDFEKLLVARSEHKWFVFEATTTSAVTAVFDRLEDLIRRFGGSRPGDRYLLAGLDAKARCVRTRVIVCR